RLVDVADCHQRCARGARYMMRVPLPDIAIADDCEAKGIGHVRAAFDLFLTGGRENVLSGCQTTCPPSTMLRNAAINGASAPAGSCEDSPPSARGPGAA